MMNAKYINLTKSRLAPLARNKEVIARPVLRDLVRMRDTTLAYSSNLIYVRNLPEGSIPVTRQNHNRSCLKIGDEYPAISSVNGQMHRVYALSRNRIEIAELTRLGITGKGTRLASITVNAIQILALIIKTQIRGVDETLGKSLKLHKLPLVLTCLIHTDSATTCIAFFCCATTQIGKCSHFNHPIT